MWVVAAAAPNSHVRHAHSFNRVYSEFWVEAWRLGVGKASGHLVSMVHCLQVR